MDPEKISLNQNHAITLKILFYHHLMKDILDTKKVIHISCSKRMEYYTRYYPNQSDKNKLVILQEEILLNVC